MVALLQWAMMYGVSVHGKSGAALAVHHVQVAGRYSDPGAAGEGLCGNLLVAQDSLAVPCPCRWHS